MTAPDVWRDKYSRVDDDSVAPLNALVRQWRSAHGTASVPWFDPDDGGVRARLLVLMESPAPRTVRPDGSGFCSLDNADRSNQQIAGMIAAAGIPRTTLVKWNVAPWALVDHAGKPRPPRQADLTEAAPLLRELLTLTTEIDVILAVGNAALSGFMLAITTQPTDKLYRVVAAPHPSQRNTAARNSAISRLDNACRAISRHLGTERST